jgi:nucleoside 2-deoxyribosyltransferase
VTTYVYVAGPINSSGRQNLNVRRAVLVGEAIRRARLVPFIPHLNVQWEMIAPAATEEEWLAWDFAWLEKCDALYRLHGDSKGADREVAFARERGLEVFLEDPPYMRREPDAVECGALTRLVLWADRRKGTP